MSAKSKKRLCKIENKLKLEKLELKDVVCSICQSILVEPVTLPCFHHFCQRCFNGSIENNALCCPLCRLRIGSWLRTATKQNNLVNVELWKFLQSRFSQEIASKLKGDDIELPEDLPTPRLSAPGEIRSEYEAELQRLKGERIQQEQKQIEETQLLIKQIQQEEKEAHKQYLERIKQDELLAKEIQTKESKSKSFTYNHITERKRRRSLRETIVRPKFRATKIDGYLAKIQAPITEPIESPLLTDDNTSTDGSTPKSVIASDDGCTPKTVKASTESSTSKSELTSMSSTSKSTDVSSNGSSPKKSRSTADKLTPITVKHNSRLSPEVVPRNGKLIKNLVDKKIKGSSMFWNKENGKKEKEEENNLSPSSEVDSSSNDIKEKKAVIKSLLVSLPLPHSSVLHHKSNLFVKKTTDTESVDSMRQELCFFKPIEKTSPTRLKLSRKLPLRVPSIHPSQKPNSLQPLTPPSPTRQPTRAQYLDSLCRLRHLSVANKLPSAFVIALDSLKVIKNNSFNMNTRQTTKRNGTDDILTMPTKKVAQNKKAPHAPNNSKLNFKTNLRRTRSMGSMVKDENETTPKKIKIGERKAISERKPHLRSDSKKLNAEKELESPPLISKTISSSKLNLAVKNLSSPLKNCEVKKILQEQLRIEKMIEQEKKDLEFARQMDAEWNGRRQLRRPPGKRQVTLNYALRPTKKVKV